jgi:hypothetical protein
MIPDAEIERMFADHIATLQHHGPIDYLRWKKPESGVFAIRYYLHGGILMINGDVGDAILQWSHSESDPKSFAWIAECNFGYYASKLQASAYGRDGKVWNEENAAQWLDQYFKDNKDEIDIKGDEFEIYTPYGHIENQHVWCDYLSRHGDKFFGSDAYEYASIGMEYDVTLYIQYRGLQAAVKQLSQKGAI